MERELSELEKRKIKEVPESALYLLFAYTGTFCVLCYLDVILSLINDPVSLSPLIFCDAASGQLASLRLPS